MKVTPETSQNLVDKRARLGYVINGDIIPAGFAADITPTGKTIFTSKGHVFKWRRAFNRFALVGNVDTDIHVFRGKSKRSRRTH